MNKTLRGGSGREQETALAASNAANSRREVKVGMAIIIPRAEDEDQPRKTSEGVGPTRGSLYHKSATPRTLDRCNRGARCLPPG